MKSIVKFLFAAGIAVGSLCGCHSDRPISHAGQAQAPVLANAILPGPAPHPKIYHLLIAKDSFAGLTNSPESNHVRVFFKLKRWETEQTPNLAIFGLTNEESEEIMVWNVRVQIPSKGKGTDGFGWDTVFSNYPGATKNCNTCQFLSGTEGEFPVDHPDGMPWRVCILYSKRNLVTNLFSGDFEVIGPLMNE